MIKAYVLVVTNPGETKHVYHSIEAVPGVTELVFWNEQAM